MRKGFLSSPLWNTTCLQICLTVSSLYSRSLRNTRIAIHKNLFAALLCQAVLKIVFIHVLLLPYNLQSKEASLLNQVRSNSTIYKWDVCWYVNTILINNKSLLGLIRVALLLYPPPTRPLGLLPDPYLNPGGYLIPIAPKSLKKSRI